MNNEKNEQSTEAQYAQGVNRDDAVLHIQTTCPECGYSFALNVRRDRNTAYSYVCPHCGKLISTYAGRPMDKTETIIGKLVYIIGFPCVIIALIIWLVNLLGGLF